MIKKIIFKLKENTTNLYKNETKQYGIEIMIETNIDVMCDWLKNGCKHDWPTTGKLVET